MYESPIQITQIGERIGTELVEQEEAYVFSVVKRMYVDVDKDELVKALAYDRGQYEKGYSDGRMAREAEIVRCKDCVYWNRDFVVEDINEEEYCQCNNFARYLRSDCFCAYGERREDGTDAG